MKHPFPNPSLERLAAALLALLLSALPLAAQQAVEEKPASEATEATEGQASDESKESATDDPAPEEIEVAEGATEIMVPMRDGVRLATNVFRPEGEGSWPAILVRTPYGKDSRAMSAFWRRYTSRGYVYVVQDVRGRNRSEGEYRPFEMDGLDGYDTVEWLAAQPWTDGKVGMSGASAMGIATNLAAAEDPPHLVAGFVMITPHSLWEQATFVGGVFKHADVGGWMGRQGVGDQVVARRAEVIESERERRVDFRHVASNVDIPILNLGGWYDVFSQGSLDSYMKLQDEGRPGARGNQKLVMGPFGHGSLEGELEYPDGTSMFRLLSLEQRWFDYWLKGIDDGVMDEPPVSYYLMASARGDEPSPKNGWRTAESWPPPAETLRLHLSADGSLVEERPVLADASITYASDPADPVPTVGGPNLTLPIGPLDQREIGERDDYLRFQTPVLEEDLTVVGPIRLELWVESDAPDTDFMAKLVHVYPDGYEALITEGALRARYRDGRHPDQIALLEPGKPELLEIDLWSTANVFAKGHRLAVHVSSSNHPRFEVNPNTGAAPGEENGESRVARNTVHLSEDMPSAIVLPVLIEGATVTAVVSSTTED